MGTLSPHFTDKDFLAPWPTEQNIRAKHLYRHSLSEDHIETLFIEINTGERTTYIGTIYKPASADCNVFIDSIQNILSSINQSKIYDLM